MATRKELAHTISRLSQLMDASGQVDYGPLRAEYDSALRAYRELAGLPVDREPNPGMYSHDELTDAEFAALEADY